MKKHALRLSFALCCFLLCGLLFAGCGGQPNAGPPASSLPGQSAPGESAPGESAPGESVPNESAPDGPITFTDDLGREVTLPGRPQRTAALIGSFASVWQLAGGELVAAAHDAFTDFDLGLTSEVADLGKTSGISLELLLAADPDFILASCNTKLDMDLLDTFEGLGIPTAYFEVSSFEQYLHMLDVCTRITGRPELYEQNGLAVQAGVNEALARADGSRPAVLYLRASASSVRAKGGSGSVLGEMLTDLGCQNIADADGSLLETLSLERILQADPDYIFIVLQGSDTETIRQNLAESLTGHPAWGSLTAVKEGRLYFMDQRLFNLKPNNRWGEAYAQLADILYPNAA